jgi:hypothetical protein
MTVCLTELACGLDLSDLISVHPVDAHSCLVLLPGVRGVCLLLLGRRARGAHCISPISVLFFVSFHLFLFRDRGSR